MQDRSHSPDHLNLTADHWLKPVKLSSPRGPKQRIVSIPSHVDTIHAAQQVPQLPRATSPVFTTTGLQTGALKRISSPIADQFLGSRGSTSALPVSNACTTLAINTNKKDCKACSVNRGSGSWLGVPKSCLLPSCAVEHGNSTKARHLSMHGLHYFSQLIDCFSPS
jgi:hypothetical protein